MDHAGSTIKGIYRDLLLGPDGQVIHDSGWVANTIVKNCRVLLAAFMKSDSQGTSGIVGLAVGEGDSSWDQELPQPTTNVPGLIKPYPNEIIVASGKLEITYLDEQTPSPDPTNQLEIKATLDPVYPEPKKVPLREFGLYGKLGDTPYLINYVMHPVIYKTETDTLIRVIRLTF